MSGPFSEIARNVVESQRLSTLIGYATAAPFAIGFLETASAIEDSSNGIWRMADHLAEPGRPVFHKRR